MNRTLGYYAGLFREEPALELISTATVSGTATAANIQFTGIPQTYKYLQIRFVARVNNVNPDVNFRFNGITTSSYYTHTITSTPSSIGFSNTTTNTGTQFQLRVGDDEGLGKTVGGGIMTIHNYSVGDRTTTIKHQTGLIDTAESVGVGGAIFNSNDAVTSMLFFPALGSFESETRISLYGVKG